MSTVKFATYGPNRGLSLFIGSYQFVDGLCEVPEKDASSASSILTRYHDVCYAHELEQKIAEYDAAQQNREAAKSGDSGQKPPKTGQNTPEKPENPETGQSASAQPEKPAANAAAKPEGEKEPPAPDDAEGKKTANAGANGKKQPGKN